MAAILLAHGFAPDLIASIASIASLVRAGLATARLGLRMPPLSALGLSRFAQFERGDFDGITYIDTFFLKRHRVADERLHFHELIHVIQWRLLGPASFLAAYADGLDRFGYRESPLEMMAYNAEASFSQSPEIFDAEKLVAQRLRRINIPARM
jgi:hypothetical protein